jgi:hypothetical protein
MKTNLAIQKVKTALTLIIVGSLIGMTMAADKSHGLSKKESDQKHAGQIEESVESPLKRKMHAYRHKILYQSCPKDNDEIFIMNADGSGQVNLTKTPEIDEFYPHASPDGRQLTFMAINKKENPVIRRVYVMDIDGKNRRLIAENARQACWRGDGKVISYLRADRGAHKQFQHGKSDLFFYEVATDKRWPHPNEEVRGLWNICWTPDNKRILTSVAGGLGYGHAIVALGVDNNKVVTLRESNGQTGDYQCRPDISPDGKRVSWVKEDFWVKWWIEVCDIDLEKDSPSLSNCRYVVNSPGKESYHPDWSPDSRYIVYSWGPHASRMKGSGQEVETIANGWDIWGVDPNEPDNVIQLTINGKSNKEPDWVFVAE